MISVWLLTGEENIIAECSRGDFHINRNILKLNWSEGKVVARKAQRFLQWDFQTDRVLPWQSTLDGISSEIYLLKGRYIMGIMIFIRTTVWGWRSERSGWDTIACWGRPGTEASMMSGPWTAGEMWEILMTQLFSEMDNLQGESNADRKAFRTRSCKPQP